MKKEEKLKIVFDFIADYLSDEEVKTKPKASEDSVVNENKSQSSRSYQIMQKMDEMDERDAEVKRAVKQAKKPLEKSFKDLKAQYLKEVDGGVRLFDDIPIISGDMVNAPDGRLFYFDTTIKEGDIMEGVEAEPIKEEPTEDKIVIDEKEQKVKGKVPSNKKGKQIKGDKWM